MKPDRRNQKPGSNPHGSELPSDFLKIVIETLDQALAPGLAEIKKIHPETGFHAEGLIFGDEILLSISLTHGPQVLPATTIHGSIDYDSSQEKPSVNDLLALCLDSIGSVFQHYLDPAYPERIHQIADASLGALEEAPFDWTPYKLIEGQKETIFVKIDKSNPTLDRMAEDWLRANDPEHAERERNRDQSSVLASEDFLEERIQAIRAAKAGAGNSGGGPIRH